MMYRNIRNTLLLVAVIWATSSFVGVLQAAPKVTVDSVRVALEAGDWSAAEQLLQRPVPPCPESLAGAYRVAVLLIKSDFGSAAQVSSSDSKHEQVWKALQLLLTGDGKVCSPEVTAWMGELSVDPLPPAVRQALPALDATLGRLAAENDSLASQQVFGAAPVAQARLCRWLLGEKPGLAGMRAQDLCPHGPLIRVAYRLELTNLTLLRESAIGNMIYDLPNDATVDSFLRVAKVWIARRPERPEGWTILAGVWYAAGSPESTLVVCERGLKVAPDDVPLRLRKAMLDIATNQGIRAVMTADRILAADSTNLHAWGVLVRAYLSENKPYLAQSTLNKLFKRDSTSGAAWELQGQLYTMQKQYDDAEKAYRRLIALDTGNLRGRLLLADLMATRGKGAEARLLLDEAVRKDSTSVEVYYFRGQLAEQAGDAESAIRDYERIMRLTDDPAARNRIQSKIAELRKKGK